MKGYGLLESLLGYTHLKAKRLLLVLLFLLLAGPSTDGLLAQPAAPRGDRPFLNAINGQIYFSDMFPGATTVAHIQWIINATLGPVWIVVPPAETGTAGDFAGVVLLRTNVVVIDLRQGVLNFGFKNPVANTVIAQSSTASATGWILRQLTSQTVNPADAGWLRLASTDVLNWRNNANAANVGITKSGAAAANVPADTFIISPVQSTAFISATANPAVAGAIRLANLDAVTFRNNANGADVNGLTKDATNVTRVGDAAGVRLGAAAATPILNYLSATAALNAAAPGASPGCSADLAVPLVGAALGDSVAIGASITLPAAYSLTGFVSAADVVSIRWCQFSGVAADPDGAGATYRASVIKH